MSCFVYGCKSGYKIKANANKKWHFFTPPKNDKKLMALWQRKCYRKDKKLSTRDTICNEHFPEHMLIKERKIPIGDGSFYTYEYERWKLQPGAYPCLFDEALGLPTLRAVKPRKPPKERQPLSTASDPQNVSNDDTHLLESSVMETTAWTIEDNSIGNCNTVATGVQNDSAAIFQDMSNASADVHDVSHIDTHESSVPSVMKNTDYKGMAEKYKMLYKKWMMKYFTLRRSMQRRESKQAGKKKLSLK